VFRYSGSKQEKEGRNAKGPEVEYWFGGIDLNATPEDVDTMAGSSGSTSANADRDSAGPSHFASANAQDGTTGHHFAPNTGCAGPSHTRSNAHSGVQTSVTLSSEESGEEGEVQSTPEGIASLPMLA
jgi:hypothetical protein